MKEKIKLLVKDIFENKIKKHGFHYIAGRSGDHFWTFSRKIDGLTQGIEIGTDFHYKPNGFGLYIHADVINSDKMGTHARVFVPENQYHTDANRNWRYESEEEIKRALHEMADAIEKYGLAELELMINGHAPTDEMWQKIYITHQQFHDQFIKKHNLEIAALNDNFEGIFDLIEKEIANCQGKKYEDVQDTLLEIASFLGVELILEVDGMWTQASKEYPDDLICLESKIEEFPILLAVVESWQRNKVKELREAFAFMVGVFPFENDVF